MYSVKPRVVIVAPAFAAIPDAVRHAFHKLGWDPTLFIYDVPTPTGIVGRALRRVLDPRMERALRLAFNRVLREEVIPSLRNSPPDLCLVLRGEYLDPDVRHCLPTEEVPFALWTYDSLSRWPTQASLAGLVHYRFHIDRADVREEDPRSMWLPLGCEDRIYYPTDEREKTIDILFVGTLGELYTRRSFYLKTVARSALPHHHTVGLIGSTGTRLVDRFLPVSTAMEWIATSLPEPLFARYVSRSRICVNVLQDDGVEPVNPAFFNIPGAGACQVTDCRAYLSEWLEPGSDYVELPVEELPDRLARLLKDSRYRCQVAEHGHETVKSGHTYTHRIQAILSKMGLL